MGPRYFLVGGDDGEPSTTDPIARALSLGKPTVAGAILKAGGEVKGQVNKKKKPLFLVVGHLPGKTKVEAARAGGVKMITVKGLATVLSGSSEAPEEANVSGKRARAYGVGQLVAQKAKDAGVGQVIFDRGGFLYHGRVAALAAGARAAGLDF